MELAIGFGHQAQNRMEEDRISRASSRITISTTNKYKVDEKLQAFGKRSRSVKRDPNCAVVIRGWLYKRDSTGLKLWKKRWFVLSNFCLFYYKDSREDFILGSLPLPSYKVFFCSPRECKNRKYAFKVVHQGMRSYLLSADTQEDMLGWVRALSQSACMETEEIINRRCSSYQDFTQIRGSMESVPSPHTDYSTTSLQYRTQNQPAHLLIHTIETPEETERGTAHSSDSQTRSWSLERPGGHQFLRQSSHPSTPRGQLQTLSPVKTHYCQEKAPEAACTHINSSPSRWMNQTDRETQSLTALQTDTDMVLTRLCGCDKLLQNLSHQLDLLIHDKEHTQFELDMMHLQMDEWQLDAHGLSQNALLQEGLVSIRAKISDILLEMERVWLDYERMESELCVFRSHLQHICYFGLSQERSVAQKQIWMMDDILSGLKPNRRRFKALMTSHTTIMLPSHPYNLPPAENLHSSESTPPARPPLPSDLHCTNQSTEMLLGWREPCDTIPSSSTPVHLHYKHTHSSLHPLDSPCFQEPCDKATIRAIDQRRTINSKNEQKSLGNKSDHLGEAQPSSVYVTRLMRVELPSVLTAQRVCVDDLNSEEREQNIWRYTLEENENPAQNRIDGCGPSDGSEANPTKETRLQRLRECVHPLLQTDILPNVRTESVHDAVYNCGQRPVTGSASPCDIRPASTNHVSTININRTAALKTEYTSCLTKQNSSNQRAEWFLSTNQWQEFIPLNIQEEDILQSGQDLSTSHTLHQSESQDSYSDPARPIKTQANDNMTCSDPSEMELSVYEDIQNSDQSSTVKHKEDAVSGATNHTSLDPSANQHTALKKTADQKLVVEPEGDVISTDIYSLMKKLGTNQRAALFKPRVTMVSTSL